MVLNWNNGFGSPRYGASFFDRRIAHLTDFETERRSSRLREHADHGDDRGRQSGSNEQIERRALEKNGIVELGKASQQEHEGVTKAEGGEFVHADARGLKQTTSTGALPSEGGNIRG